MKTYLIEEWNCRDGGFQARREVEIDKMPEPGDKIVLTDGEWVRVDRVEDGNLIRLKGCTDSSRYDLMLDSYERDGKWESRFC